MSNYTAEDFANAQFATADGGMLAMRSHPGVFVPWMFLTERGTTARRTDHSMVREGWAPVRQATITQSDLDTIEARWRADMSYKFADVARDLGLNVVPESPLPNAERWNALINEYAEANTNLTFGAWADINGIQAPGDGS